MLSKAEKNTKIIRVIILFLAMTAYGFCFSTIHMSLGNGAFIVMNVFPIAAGMLLGMNIGSLTGITSILFVIFLGSTVHLDFQTFLNPAR